MDVDRKSRMKLMPNAYTVDVFSLKTTTAQNKFDVKNVYSGHPRTNNPKIARVFVCVCVFVTGVRNDIHLFIEAAKCYENFTL